MAVQGGSNVGDRWGQVTSWYTGKYPSSIDDIIEDAEERYDGEASPGSQQYWEDVRDTIDGDYTELESLAEESSETRLKDTAEYVMKQEIGDNLYPLAGKGTGLAVAASPLSDTVQEYGFEALQLLMDNSVGPEDAVLGAGLLVGVPLVTYTNLKTARIPGNIWSLYNNLAEEAAQYRRARNVVEGVLESTDSEYGEQPPRLLETDAEPLTG